MLIERQQTRSSNASSVQFPSPVVGAEVNDKKPTAGDVHLYADPQTYSTKMPMIYADCEGLEGGENLPYGSQTRKRTSDVLEGGRFKRTPPPRMLLGGRTRQVAWATNENAKRREFAVTELYPRLLYTFSDVIVFVLRNAK